MTTQQQIDLLKILQEINIDIIHLSGTESATRRAQVLVEMHNSLTLTLNTQEPEIPPYMCIIKINPNERPV